MTSAGTFITLGSNDRQAWPTLLGQLCQHVDRLVHGYCLASDPYHLPAQTPEGCRASGCSIRRARQGGRLFGQIQRSLAFHPRLQAPARRLPERLPGGRKIVLANGRIVLTHLAWYALSLVQMRVRSGGFTHVLLQDLTQVRGSAVPLCVIGSLWNLA